MDLKQIGYGLVSFFCGVFFMMISIDLFTDITSILNTGANAIGDSAEATIWIGIILVWLLTTIVLPVYFIHKGTRIEGNTPDFIKVIIGGLIFFFGVLITYQTWFMINGISDAITNTTIQTFFWVGIIVNWLMLVVITPLYLIMDGTNKLPPQLQ